MLIVINFYVFNIFFILYSVSCIKNPRKYPDEQVKKDIENGRKIPIIRKSEKLWCYGNGVRMKSWLVVSIAGIVVFSVIMPSVANTTDACIILMLIESVIPQLITGYKLWKKDKE